MGRWGKCGETEEGAYRELRERQGRGVGKGWGRSGESRGLGKNIGAKEDWEEAAKVGWTGGKAWLPGTVCAKLYRDDAEGGQGGDAGTWEAARLQAVKEKPVRTATPDRHAMLSRRVFLSEGYVLRTPSHTITPFGHKSEKNSSAHMPAEAQEVTGTPAPGGLVQREEKLWYLASV